MKKAIIGIGTNIGNKDQNINIALRSISLLPETEVIKSSSIYETAPVGFTEQENFFNICVLIETCLSPFALLGACLGIEAAMGRERPFRNSPRIIDIDLLIYEDYTSNDCELILPHPRMFERAFVLVPLSELFPKGIALGKDFSKSLKDVPKDGVCMYKK